MVWRGGAGRHPAPVVDKLNREINRILTLPDVTDKLTAMGPGSRTDDTGLW